MALDGIDSKTGSSVAQFQRQADVLRQLGRLRTSGENPQRARATAAKLVSEIAFKPMLAEMRQSPLGDTDWITGGRMGQAFAERLDERVADVVAQSQGGLADAFAQYLTRPGQAAGSDTPNATSAQNPPAADSTAAVPWWQQLADLVPGVDQLSPVTDTEAS